MGCRVGAKRTRTSAAVANRCQNPVPLSSTPEDSRGLEPTPQPRGIPPFQPKTDTMSPTWDPAHPAAYRSTQNATCSEARPTPPRCTAQAPCRRARRRCPWPMVRSGSAGGPLRPHSLRTLAPARRPSPPATTCDRERSSARSERRSAIPRCSHRDEQAACRPSRRASCTATWGRSIGRRENARAIMGFATNPCRRGAHRW